MKGCFGAALAIALLSLAHVARAQQCYSTVQSWDTKWSLSGTANPPVACAGGGKCTVSQSAANTGPIGAPFVTSCGALAWTRSGSIASAAVNDVDTQSCAPDAGDSTETFADATSPSSMDVLSINQAAGTYYYLPSPFANVTETTVTCPHLKRRRSPSR